MTDPDRPSLESLIESASRGLEILHPGGTAITDELAERCGVGAGTRVLDVACGPGETACRMAERSGARVVGLDHRLFSFISRNWRGKPLVSRSTIVNLIAATKTKAGLEVYAYLNENEYPLRRKISDEQMKSVKITRDEFHGEWNYTIQPRVN